MSIKPREEYQKTGTNYNFEDNYIPEFVSEFFISNIITRALAHLFGFDDFTNKPVRLRATPDGKLKVDASLQAFSENETHKITVSAGSEITINFADISSKVEVWTYAGTLKIARSVDGSVFQDYIEIPDNSYYSFEASTKSLKVRNDGTSDYDIQVVAWR